MRFRGERVVVRGWRQIVAEPLQAEAGALGDAHHVPCSGDRVTEGVDAPRRIVGWRFGVREDDAGGSDGARDEPRLDDSVAYRAGRLIAASANHGRPFGKAGSSAALRDTFPVISCDS